MWVFFLLHPTCTDVTKNSNNNKKKRKFLSKYGCCCFVFQNWKFLSLISKNLIKVKANKLFFWEVIKHFFKRSYAVQFSCFFGEYFLTFLKQKSKYQEKQTQYTHQVTLHMSKIITLSTYHMKNSYDLL